MAGWILFRSDSCRRGVILPRTLRPEGLDGLPLESLENVINGEGWIALVVGVVAATRLGGLFSRAFSFAILRETWVASPAGVLAVIFLLLGSAMKLARYSSIPSSTIRSSPPAWLPQQQILVGAFLGVLARPNYCQPMPV